MTYEQQQGPQRNKLCFNSGEAVKGSEEAVNSSFGHIRTQYNTSYEIGRRIALGEASYKELKRILLDRKICIKRKLQIYRACIATKVLYGLETLSINVRDLQRLQTFEHRILRRILKIPVSMISRVSNEEVVQQSQTTTCLPNIPQTAS